MPSETDLETYLESYNTPATTTTQPLPSRSLGGSHSLQLTRLFLAALVFVSRREATGGKNADRRQARPQPLAPLPPVN